MDLRIFFVICLAFGALAQNSEETTTNGSMPGNVTVSTSTESPSTTTTAPDTTTSTASPNNTTTSTSAPETTTPKPSPSPSPSVKYFYNISNSDGIQCIMIDGKFSFKVTYNIQNNKTNETVVVVPAPSPSVNVSGSCGAKISDKQFIEISWGDAIKNNNIRLSFSASNNSKNWYISSFTSKIFMDEDQFVNASDAGSSLMSVVNMTLMPNEVPMNHSFMCYASLNFANISTKLDGGPYQYPVQLMIDGVRIQAFNRVKTANNKFVEEIHCEADKIADVVPIAVGCALGVLVLIVLVAYIVGRRRRSGAYQSV